MNPIIYIKGEHAAIVIILDAMKKLALDMRIGKFIDSYRIVPILDFLHTYSGHSHYEKEEKCLYPALLECDIPWTVGTINHLTDEHLLALVYINEIDTLFQEYLSGNAQILNSLSLSMIDYVELEKRHINTIDNVVLPLFERIFDTQKLKSITKDIQKIHHQNVGQRQEYYKLLAMLLEENDVISENVYF